MIRFSAPWLLLALPLFLLLTHRFVRVQRSRHATRIVTLLLVLLAFAGPELQVRRANRNILFVVDRSASVSRAIETRELQAQINQLAEPSEGLSFGVVEFAADASVASPLQEIPGSLSAAPVESDASDLARAVDLALATLPPGDANQLVLISDGRPTGEAERAIGAAQLSGTPICVLPAGGALDGDVILAAFRAPAEVSPGRPFALDARIESKRATAAVLALYRNGQLALRQEMLLDAGENWVTFSDTLSESGSYEYRLVIRAESDPIPENDALSRVVRTSTRPPILLVEGGEPSAMSALLEAADLDFTEVDEVPSLDILSSYRQLILVGVPPDSLTAQEATDIERFARNLGGGVFIVQGENEVRGFERSAIEDILPVSYAVPEREVVPSLAIVFLLDRSSSMRALSGSYTKIRMLRNAAAASITLLPAETRVGVVAFDDLHSWIVPIRPVGDGLEIYDALQGLRANGGTELHAPLDDALSKLIDTEARSKHLILISDGRTSDEDRDFPGLMETLRAQENITLSAIALGDSPDFELLGQLVDAGSGALYHVTDFLKLPQLTMQVTQRLSRSRFVTESSEVTGPAIEAAGLTDVPHLSGYVLTFPRASARTDLWAGSDPLFSTWQIGLGSVSVLNTDLAGIWSGGWVSWPQLSVLMEELIRSTQPITLSSSGLYPAFEVDGARTKITVDVREGDGALANFVHLTATMLPERATFTLPQVAPGLYAVTIPSPEEGGYALQIAETFGGREVVLPISIPYAAEFEETGVDEASLRRIADLTGGLVLAPGDPLPEIDARKLARFRPIRRELLAAAMALFLLDLLLRKIPRQRRRRPADRRKR